MKISFTTPVERVEVPTRTDLVLTAEIRIRSVDPSKAASAARLFLGSLDDRMTGYYDGSTMRITEARIVAGEDTS